MSNKTKMSTRKAALNLSAGNSPKNSSPITNGKTVHVTYDFKKIGIDIKNLSPENKMVMTQIMKYLDSKLEESKKVVESLIKENFDLKSENKAEIESLKKENNDLKSRVLNLEEKIDANKAIERRDTLIISGHIPSVTANENCNEIVRKLVGDTLRIPLDQHAIAGAYRIGKTARASGPDQRNISFKLSCQANKQEIFKRCRTMKPSFYINESLTPIRSTIMYVLRKAKQQNPSKFGNARSSNGNVIVYIPRNTPASVAAEGADGSQQGTDGTQQGADGPRTTFSSIKKIINTRKSLDELLQQQIQCSSDKFEVTWPN